jgi:hypothetical protein
MEVKTELEQFKAVPQSEFGDSTKFPQISKEQIEQEISHTCTYRQTHTPKVMIS